MTRGDADRELIYGILALNNGFIDRQTLIDALRGPAAGEAGPLGRVLRDRGLLDPVDSSLLDALVERHVARRGGDLSRSLADADPSGSVREMLSLIEGTRTTDAPPSAETRTFVEGEDGLGVLAGRGIGRQGTAWARFHIVRPYARGGLGEIYLAVDDELNRVVALKRIQERHADDPRSQVRFLVEGEITGGLEHPGIVPVYGLGLDDRDGRPYYAMRLIRGESLREAIRRFHEGDDRPGSDPAARALELRQLLGRFVDVCDAMEYAHSRGVLHRDLKPANIMLGRYGETLVVDWGLARASGRAGEADALAAHAAADPDGAEVPLRPRSGSEPVETVAGSICGTPGFMSPEQAAGDTARLGPASDIYSLGATLYCLLTGRPPFQGDDLPALLARVARGEFPPPRAARPEVPVALEAVCLKAMATAPEARYPSPRLLAQDVERWLADEPVSALREPWTERARRWARRHRSLVTAGAAALVVVLIALGGIVALESQSNRRLRLANARERRAREQAQARFGLARDAVAGYYRGVSEDVLLRRTEFRDLRRSLLKSAQDFYRQLATTLEADQEVEPAARLDLARAELALARITGEIASTGDALKAAEPARALLARLAAERPDDPGLRRELAGVLALIGSYHEATGQTDAALAALGRALRIRQALAAAPGATADDRVALAGTHTSIGNRLDATGRPAEALLSYQEASKILKPLVDEHPDRGADASDLARVLYSISRVHGATGRINEALRAAEESHATRRRLAEAHPDDDDLQRELASSFENLGHFQDRNGRSAEALESYQQCASLYQKVVAARPTATKLRRQWANAYNNIGRIHGQAQRVDEALRAFHKARELQEALVEDNPDDLEYPNDLATSLVNLGITYGMIGRHDDTLKLYERALVLRQKLATANPQNTNERSKLAWTHYSIGALYAETDRLEQSLGPLEQSRALRQSLVDAHPDLTEPRLLLAQSLQTLGFVQSKLGRQDEALRWLDQARVVQEALVRLEPGTAVHRQELARTWLFIGTARLRAGRHEEALKADEEARARFVVLVRDNPDDVESRFLLGGTWNNSGDALVPLKRHEEAVAAYREAVIHLRAAFERSPGVLASREQLSNALGNLSEALLTLRRPAEAAASAREIRALWPRDGDHLYAAARLLASCAPLAQADRARGPRPDPGQAGRLDYLDEAMDFLRRAVDAGFRDARRLAEDAALAPLRPRADFRSLAIDVGFPADPFR